MRRAVTQKEIAARLGISQALVSCALNGKAVGIGASEETIERIQNEARRLNYVPSAPALELRGAGTKTIGVVVKDFEDPFFGKLIGALQARAAEIGHSLLLTAANSRDLSSLRKHRVDGIVFLGSHSLTQTLEKQLAAKGVPVVQAGWDRKIRGVVQVAMDDALALRSAAEHLLRQGHRDIGFVAGEDQTGKRRGTAFRRVMESLGGDTRWRIFEGPQDGIVAGILRAKSSGIWCPAALIASDDLLALRLSFQLQAAGQCVPGEFSIVGIDDIPFAAMAVPALTTIRQPLEKIAEEVFRRLLHSEEDTFLPDAVRLSGTLVVRASTSPPKSIHPTKNK